MEIYNRKYVPLISDAGFKAVFACRSNKELLIELLNHLLPEEVVVKDIIEYCDREQQQDTAGLKRSLLDLVCRGEDGSQFIVEVQDECYADFFSRVVYYAAGVYHLPLSKGQGYGMLRPVYVVSILNYRMKHDDESLWDTDYIISHYDFIERLSSNAVQKSLQIRRFLLPLQNWRFSPRALRNVLRTLTVCSIGSSTGSPLSLFLLPSAAGRSSKKWPQHVNTQPLQRSRN